MNDSDVGLSGGLLPDYMIRNRTRIPADCKEDYIRRRRLVIDPFVDYGECPEGVVSYGLTSGGYDLRVGGKFALFANTSGCIVSPKRFRLEAFNVVDCALGTPVVIPPNCFALAETVEYLEVPDDVLIETLGKSTYARCGYVLPVTPFEPGWRGKVTLEIGNLSPLPMEVYPFEGIGQMLFHQLAAFPQHTYDTKPRKHYQDQSGLTPPRVRGA